MKKKSIDTRLVHADRKINQPQYGAIHEATNNSVLFEFKDVQDLVNVFQGKQAGHVYSRSSTASAVSLQNIISDLDDGVGSVVFSTGMAAISALMFSLLKAGDHIVVSQYLFGNTRSFIETIKDFGVQVSLVDVTDIANVERALNANTKMVFSETIANPVTQVADLTSIGNFCEQHGLLFVLDNTMTPSCLFDAKSVKTSLIVTSLTKYVSGHGNALGGAIIDTGLFDWSTFNNIKTMYKVADTSQWGLTQIRKKGLRDMGATISAHAAHQISVGLETMTLRLQRTCTNALHLANYLNKHPMVEKVYYPGLKQHPQHKRAKSLFPRGFGGILGVELAKDINPHDFLNKLELVICATHLGDTRTLALPAASTIFYENGELERRRMGIADGLIRLSVGIEDIDDLTEDFELAFELLCK